jgi:hypothetical protein
MAPPSTGIIAHRAGDVGRGGGEHERGRLAELLGLAVPAQRDVLRQAGTHLIGIAAKGIKFTDLSAAILTGSSPLTGAWPGRVRWRVSSPPRARPANSPLGNGQLRERPAHREGQHEDGRGGRPGEGAGHLPGWQRMRIRVSAAAGLVTDRWVTGRAL